MPRCEHKGATCIVGDFWTCKTPGCKNGPQEKEPDLRIRWRRLEFDWTDHWFPFPEFDDEKTPVDRFTGVDRS